MLPSILLVGALVSTLASGYPTKPYARRDVDPSLVPEFGVTPGQNPTGTGDCSGSVPGVEIPCDCPPPRDLFLQDLNANIAAGHCVNNTGVAIDFPTDDSIQSQITRIHAVIVSLQNLRGPGVGCPSVSTNLGQVSDALQAQLDGKPAPAPTTTAAAKASSTPVPAPTANKGQAAIIQPSSTPAEPVSGSCGAAPAAEKAVVATTVAAAAPPASTAPAGSNGKPSPAQIAATAPSLGFTAGQNPTGTGNCSGAIPGGPEVPCSCPPDQADFLTSLEANVAAGFAVHNPSVPVAWPLDDSKASQAIRIESSLTTLQNLSGPGVGCPAVSTTLSAQLKAVQG